ncbi:MAG: hypothetical protein LBK29_00765 [Oscillospiraceae bacterium]|jgi:cell division protein FtsI/penicillin-binding protein 2|nr:hypothetical protein [Oscillospiraceae bacterium]
MMLFFIGYIVKIHKISIEGNFQETVANQNSYKLNVTHTRGKIYDCRGVSLVGGKSKFLAAIVPCAKTFEVISSLVDKNSIESIGAKFKSVLPFIIEIPKKVEYEGINVFEIPERYSDTAYASHIIGYLSSENRGAYGIERAFEDHLSRNGEIELRYGMNAKGEILCKDPINIKSDLKNSGVVLQIDKRIQIISEDIANKYISKGAVIVTEVPNCEIRACASFPSFLPNGIKHCLNDESSPLLNRALCQYNVGSIFKLVTAAAACECDLDEYFTYNCQGLFSEENNVSIHCFSGIPHGRIDVGDAISLSCNGFFVKISKKIDPKFFIKISSELGFGKPIELAPYIIASEGNLPSKEEIEDSKKMAMFSFGQGSLMASPVQISGIINAICCGGTYSKPVLVKALIGEDAQITNFSADPPKQVFKQKTAEKLKKYMKRAVTHGTAKRGKPDLTTAGAKTSTAETGIIKNEQRVNQSWFAGFFPFEKPKYCVVVLSEDDDGGGKNCGPVFKEIADEINKMENLEPVFKRANSKFLKNFSSVMIKKAQ